MVLYICAYTARILYLPIDACKIGIEISCQNIDLGHLAESAVYENDIMYIPFFLKKKIVKIQTGACT